MSRDPAALGAYGLALDGVEAAASFLIPAHPDWPRFEIVNTIGTLDRVGDRLGEDRAEITLRSGGALFVDRLESKAEFVTPEPLSPDELAHPGLAPVAAVTARWLGRQSFHAGAFAIDTDVWGVLAEREGGKSTTLAWLAAHRHPIVCDDMLVLDGDAASRRPADSRSSRGGGASGWDWATTAGGSGSVSAGACRSTTYRPSCASGAGSSSPGETTSPWSRVRAGERLPRLAQHLGLRVPPARPDRLLELAALPGWEFRRPRGWDRFDEAGSRLLEVLAG